MKIVNVSISSQNSSNLTPNGKCRACSLVLKVFAEIKGEQKRVPIFLKPRDAYSHRISI